MDKSRHGTKEPEMIEIKKINSNKSKNINKTKSLSELLCESLNSLKVKLSSITLRPNTIHLLVKYVMEEVENQPIKGSEQKDLALELIKNLIIDLSDKEDEETLLKLLNDGTISNIIDIIIDATKGKLNINTSLTVATGCINTCIPYLFSSKNKK